MSWRIEIACNDRCECERTRDWLEYYSFGEDRVKIVEEKTAHPVREECPRGYSTFEEWYQESEGFTLRAERLASPVNELRAAFDAGRTDPCREGCKIKRAVKEMSDSAASDYTIEAPKSTGIGIDSPWNFGQ